MQCKVTHKNKAKQWLPSFILFLFQMLKSYANIPYDTHDTYDTYGTRDTHSKTRIAYRVSCVSLGFFISHFYLHLNFILYIIYILYII